jgi:hypothetical protein
MGCGATKAKDSQKLNFTLQNTKLDELDAISKNFEENLEVPK